VSKDARGVGPLAARSAFERLAAEILPAAGLTAVLALHGRAPVVCLSAFLIALFMATRLREGRRLGWLAPLSSRLCWLVPTLTAAAVAALIPASSGGGSVAVSATALLASWVVVALGAWELRLFNESVRLRYALIGDRESAGRFAIEFDGAASNYRPPLHLAGRISLSSASDETAIGSIGDLRAAVIEHDLDLLVFADGGELEAVDRARVLDAAVTCLDLPVRLMEGTQAYEEILGHVPIAITGSRWIEPMLHPEYRPGSAAAARVRDVALVVLLAPLALLVLGVCAAAIAITDGRPIFFRQRRIGTRGSEFTVTKLRSMRDDALADHAWAEADDPRVTSIGSFLRRSHLDELPQLWSVLKGEMSLVGPRPEVPDVVSRLEKDFPYYDRRHLIKPGLTGWAQVRCGYAGSNSGSAWKLCFDLYYLKHRSFTLDMLILVETVRAVFTDSQYGMREPDPRFIMGGMDELDPRFESEAPVAVATPPAAELPRVPLAV
jgi:lipopolysaccharide/colanic/teichoic acid biosynthesis glycosyltransferase